MPVQLYQKFQYIAYHFPTDKESNPGQPVASDLVSQQQILAMKQAVPDEDLVSRFTRFMAALDVAMKSDHVDPDTTTLKIFAAPEFYFRPLKADNSRSYSEAAKKGFLDFLELFFKKDTYNHWLLILGTIIWHSDNADLVTAALKGTEDEGKTEDLLQNLQSGISVWNTAIAVVGNVEVKTFQKTNYSTDDGIEKRYWPRLDDNDSFKRADKEVVRPRLKTFFKKQGDANQPKSVFEVQGAGLVGIEICKDHDSGFLRYVGYDAYLKKHPNAYCKTLIFQALTSCGMTLLPKKIALQKPGLFALAVDGTGIQCEGPSPEESTPPQSQIQCVVKLTQKNNEALKIAEMCSSLPSEGNVPKWNTLNAREETLPIPANLQFVTPDRGYPKKGANVNQPPNDGFAYYTRSQEIAVYKAWEFAAEMEQEQEEQEQVNNANGNLAQQQQL